MMCQAEYDLHKAIPIQEGCDVREPMDEANEVEMDLKATEEAGEYDVQRKMEDANDVESSLQKAMDNASEDW